MKLRSVQGRYHAAVLLTCLASGTGLAQTDGAQRAAPTPVEGATLEEVTVTAERRTTNLQETPVSIAVFGSAALQGAGIVNTEQLAYSTPGLTIQRDIVSKVTLRGIGTENLTIGGDPGVAIHSDGAYIARSSVGIFDFFDIDRVEVLRGPQGTLYGRNATGGAINVFSKQPTEDFETSIRLTVGNYDTLRADAAVSGAIVPGVLLGRVAVLRGLRDGYTKNIFPGSEARGLDQLDNQDLKAGRVQLSWLPTQGLRVDLKGELYDDDSIPTPYKYLDRPLPWMTPPFDNAVYPTNLRVVSNGYEFNMPGTSVHLETAGKTKQSAVQGKVTLDLADNLQLTSLSAYRDTKFRWLNDGDGIDPFLVNYFQSDDAHQFTQELQLTSSKEQSLQWLVGAFYFKEAASTQTGIPIPFGFDLPLFVLVDGQHHTDAYALFGQASYRFAEKFRLTGGLRFNYEEKAASYLDQNVGVNTQVDDSDNWSAVTPKLGLDYFVNDDVMLYASVTRGFKSGGFNLLAVQKAYQPEFVWAYESGAKTTWLSGRLRANLAAFYYKLSDQQIGKVVNQQAVITNAASSTIYGADIDLTALVAEHLEISAKVGLLHTRFNSFTTEDPGGTFVSPGVLPVVDLSGNQLARSPKVQGEFAGTYTIPLGSWGNLALRGSWQHQGSQYFSQFNRPNVAQESFDLFHARLVLTGASERWSVGMFVNNLTNKDYISNILESGVVQGIGVTVAEGMVGPPRTYGLTVSFNYE